MKWIFNDRSRKTNPVIKGNPLIKEKTKKNNANKGSRSNVILPLLTAHTYSLCLIFIYYLYLWNLDIKAYAK